MLFQEDYCSPTQYIPKDYNIQNMHQYFKWSNNRGLSACLRVIFRHFSKNRGNSFANFWQTGRGFKSGRGTKVISSNSGLYKYFLT